VTPDSNSLPGARRPSWTTIYTTGVPFLRKTLRQLGVAEPDFEDTLQDILFAAYRALDRYDATRYAPAVAGREDDLPAEDPEEAAAATAALARWRPRAAWNPLCAWLFGIAWRQVNHYRERAYRRNEVPAGLTIPSLWGEADERPGPEAAVAAKERAALIGEALDRLDLGRRCVLILHDVLDLGIAEMARQLGINRNTAQNRLRVARAELLTAIRWMGEEKRRALQLDERSPPPGEPTLRASRRRRPRR
jgi:RNA polymerase sigma-70 factor (ECF subfamily)